MVHKDSQIYRMEELRDKKSGLSIRLLNQWLLIFRALKNAGMTPQDVDLVEMRPPDMPAGLYAKAVDAISSGEPSMAQTELDGYGRVLWLTKDVWPNFISCVLAVHEDMIKNDRDTVQRLVDGIAKSGKWIDKNMEHRMETAQFVSKFYYNQNPRLLTFVLSKPPDRVKYTNLALRKPNFEQLQKLRREPAILIRPPPFN